MKKVILGLFLSLASYGAWADSRGDATFVCETTLDYSFANPTTLKVEIRSVPMRVTGALRDGVAWGDLTLEVGARRVVYHDTHGFAYVGHLGIEAQLNTGEGFSLTYSGPGYAHNWASYVVPVRTTHFRATNNITRPDKDPAETNYPVACTFQTDFIGQ